MYFSRYLGLSGSQLFGILFCFLLVTPISIALISNGIRDEIGDRMLSVGIRSIASISLSKVLYKHKGNKGTSRNTRGSIRDIWCIGNKRANILLSMTTADSHPSESGPAESDPMSAFSFFYEECVPFGSALSLDQFTQHPEVCQYTYNDMTIEC